MSVDLPRPIANFFAAETMNDPAALAQCFVGHGVVRDEGRTIEGETAIRQWMEEAKKTYQFTVEPLAVAQRDGKIIVTGKVSGNFPNSPVNLDHMFELDGDKIASLEIR